jgi:unsaturated rhamnogalacturonyl hydrolase
MGQPQNKRPSIILTHDLGVLAMPRFKIHLMLMISVIGFASLSNGQTVTTQPVQPVTAEESQLGKGKIIGLDCFFNHQIRNGQQFHYTWDDIDRNSGFSKFADIWRQFGATPAKLEKAPTLADLSKFSIYIIVNPNNATKAADHKPNFIMPDDIQAMTTWVNNGGVIVVFANDEKNGGCEFVHLNQLSQKFGITFNNVLRNEVPTPNDTARGTFSASEFPDHPLFKGVNLIFMKEIVTLSIADPAKAILSVKKEPGEAGEGKDVLIASSQMGKGLFVAICDPWFYNEYIDLNRPGFPIENRKAAMNLVRWLLPISALPEVR